jgi:hypothetical protein
MVTGREIESSLEGVEEKEAPVSTTTQSASPAPKAIAFKKIDFELSGSR